MTNDNLEIQTFRLHTGTSMAVKTRTLPWPITSLERDRGPATQFYKKKKTSATKTSTRGKINARSKKNFFVKNHDAASTTP